MSPRWAPAVTDSIPHEKSSRCLREVVDRFPEFARREEALYRLVESNMSLGIASEAQATAAVLGHNFPNSPWYQNAYTLLKNDGLSPQANSGSWISSVVKSLTPGGGQQQMPEPAPAKPAPGLPSPEESA